jgi:hypothetical protein
MPFHAFLRNNSFCGKKAISCPRNVRVGLRCPQVNLNDSDLIYTRDRLFKNVVKLNLTIVKCEN